MSLKEFSFSQVDVASGVTFGKNMQMKHDGAKVYGRCGFGAGCAGGGGGCGFGAGCAGGGGRCGFGAGCAGQ